MKEGCSRILVLLSALQVFALELAANFKWGAACSGAGKERVLAA